jgi:DNA-binding transcriptional MocR family regulator
VSVSRLVSQLGPWSTRSGPLYRRLAEAVRASIERGDLPVGTRLPPERVLARVLDVSRTTVVQAYDRLRAEDWLESRQGSGTWVRRVARHSGWPVLTPVAVPALRRDAIVRSLTAERGPTLDFTCACLPPLPGIVEETVAEIGPDLHEATRDHGYSALGIPPLRRAIARYLERRGLPTSERQVLVTSGAQQAIALLAAAFVQRGDLVLLESPSYLGAIDVLTTAGASLVALPVGPGGVRLDLLHDLGRRRPARLLYLIPTFHNPTGAVMPEPARRETARLATDLQLPIVEDDSLADISLGATPPLPIAALHPGAPVITIGSMSKLFWGGLRVGWIRAPEALLARLASLKVASDLGSSVLSQLVGARLLDKADRVQRQRRLQLVERRDALCALLEEKLPSWSWTRPEGGLSLWVRLPQGDASEYTQVALRHGVSLLPGPVTSPDGGHPEHLRLVFIHEPAVLADGVERLARAWDAYLPLAGQTARALSVVV